jgi:hypothetical protein
MYRFLDAALIRCRPSDKYFRCLTIRLCCSRLRIVCPHPDEHRRIMNSEEIMNVQLRGFVLSVILAAAAATPAMGQGPTAVPPAGGAAPNATSMPDFSGVWTHPYFPGFEPPASGPGPVLNKSRRPRDGVGNANQFVGDYSNPILKPNAAEVVRKHGEISLAGGHLSDTKQSMLALRSSLHFFPTRNADAAAAGKDHFPLSSQS